MVPSDPEISVPRTHGADELEPTLEETYGTAVEAYKHGRGHSIDHY